MITAVEAKATLQITDTYTELSIQSFPTLILLEIISIISHPVSLFQEVILSYSFIHDFTSYVCAYQTAFTSLTFRTAVLNLGGHVLFEGQVTLSYG